jgi:hypothetical protein
MTFRFDHLHPEDKFSPEERRHIDAFWHAITSELSDAFPREVEHALWGGSALREHLQDSEVLKILASSTEEEFNQAIPRRFQGNSFGGHMVPSIKKVWESLRSVHK